MGGGVAVGDVNNDGLQDIYFTGNMVENKLYLNKGNLKFEDITIKANVASDDRWVTGVTMTDVNGDGWMDIYISVSGKFTTTKNQLFINQGVNENGIPVFTEEAEKRGVADEGKSTQGTFFDYDKDGDLDLYVANYPATGFKTPTYSYAIFMDKKDPIKSDKFYRNTGDGTFEEITNEAGLLNFGLSLSATVGDFNQDGWEDIYVSNDFASPDHFYFNNGDGTFTDRIKEVTQHTSFFGMGTDAADFNNDGLLDILQMDMTPEDNRRNKANMAGMNVAGFWEIVNRGMHYQYMQNSVQLNNGIAEDGLPHFSDISRITGMSSTDWSWAGLLADLDNDGWKDAFITNGTRRDINNKDYFNKIEKAPYPVKKDFKNLDLTLNMPSEEVDNYAFKNNGDFTFSPSIKEWGLSFEGFSNGASYADLDNDGDLEVIINNIDAPSIIFQNKTVDLKKGNFLRIQLKGNEKNPLGLGTKVTLKNKGQTQYQESSMTRGFQSSVEPMIHFGLGMADKVDSIIVVWPDQKTQVISNILANTTLVINHSDSKINGKSDNHKSPKLFETVATEDLMLNHMHEENVYNDFEKEILLPHQTSMFGPNIGKGDLNGDGLEDIVVGGSSTFATTIYFQQGNEFKKLESEIFDADKISEDMGIHIFDVENDGDQDIYIASGGNEFSPDSKDLQDRLYLNDGKGNFLKSELPEMLTSSSRVYSHDFDKDGDMDLFVGGRLVPGNYPSPTDSYILENKSTNGNVKFENVTTEIAPALNKLGMVTDAIWTDYDNDGWTDLIVVGEWMPIVILKNEEGEFKDISASLGVEDSRGWWFSIEEGDFDKDGDMDYIVGNLGLNYKYKANENETFDIYFSDFDKNSKKDIVLSYYNKGEQFPVRGRQCSSQQIPAIKNKFKNYEAFSVATLEDVYTKDDLEKSLHYQIKSFASIYLENKPDGFEFHALPNFAQISSINKILVEDYNKDGHMDAIIVGNLHASEVETPRSDAGVGLLLHGNGKGEFTPVTARESGLLVSGDVKDMMKININGKDYLVAAKNQDALQFVKIQNQELQ
jgi:hypothetical protein